jgi:hypothetical protein
MAGRDNSYSLNGFSLSPITQDSIENIRPKFQPPPAALNFPAAATEKVQKKMSAAQGVGLEEPDYPRC